MIPLFNLHLAPNKNSFTDLVHREVEYNCVKTVLIVFIDIRKGTVHKQIHNIVI